MEAKEVIKKLGLSPHPEGGYYKRMFSSDKQTIEGKGLISSIYYKTVVKSNPLYK